MHDSDACAGSKNMWVIVGREWWAYPSEVQDGVHERGLLPARVDHRLHT
jgi:hypothetical protein